MRKVIVVGIAAVLAILAAPARAEDVQMYVADGDAAATVKDPRTAALDDAFGRAVTTALGELVDGEARKANKQAIDREIIARSRLWVAKFKVQKDQTNDGRRQLTVEVSVDRDKMRVRLGELSVPLQGEQPQGTGALRTAIVLLRVVDTQGVRASFGVSADKDVAGLGPLSATLRSGGLTLLRPPTAGAVKAGGELPLDDDEADAVASDAKSDAAVVANVTVGAPVAARGVADPAVMVTARVRLVGKGKKMAGDGSATIAVKVPAEDKRSAGPAASPIVHDAIERALVAAAEDVVGPPRAVLGQSQGFKGDDTPVAEAGVVLIRVPAKTPYPLVAAELKYLAGAKGVTRAGLRRVSQSGWVIGVHTSESVQRIAQIARKAPANDISATVKVANDLVELALAATTAAPP